MGTSNSSSCPSPALTSLSGAEHQAAETAAALDARLAAALTACPALEIGMAQDPGLRLVLLDRGVGAALAVCPPFGEQLARDPRLVAMLRRHSHTCAALAPCCSALAAPLVYDDTLAKALGHNEALGQEGGAAPSWALVRLQLPKSCQESTFCWNTHCSFLAPS